MAAAAAAAQQEMMVMEAQLNDQEDMYENELAMMTTELQQVSRQRIHRLVQEKI